MPAWPYEFPGVYWVDDQEEEAVLEVLRAGSMFRYYGLEEPRFVDRYEALARDFYGVEYALGVNSGTGALSICLAALSIGPGCEVIVPSFLWVATVGAVVRAGAIPVLCEIDDTFSLDPADLAEKITDRTRLVIPIHMAGAPCDMEAILAVTGPAGIPVLEDCAQCNGGSIGGRKVGSFGDMGIFSLQLNKNMTCGEGGLIVTSDERLYGRAFSSHDMGMTRIDGRLSEPPAADFMWGQGRRMAELVGAVASVQMQKLPRIVEHMRASKARIKKGLADVDGITFRRLVDENGDTGPFLIFSVDGPEKAVAVTGRLKEAGLHNVFRVADYGLHIYSSIPALVRKTPLSSAGEPWSLAANQGLARDYAPGACPRSDELFARSILLPIPSRLDDATEVYAIETIRSALEVT